MLAAAPGAESFDCRDGILRIAIVSLVAIAVGLAAILAALLVHPYYAHRLADMVGSDHRGYRSIVHSDTMQSVNAARLSQGEETALAFFGASTIERLDIRRFGSTAVNLAYGGWTSRDVLQYARGNAAFAETRTVVVLAGFNDLAAGRSPREIADDIAALLALRLPSKPVLLVGVLPVNPANLGTASVPNEAIETLNDYLEATCREAANCRFVDPAKGPHAFSAPLPASLDSGDGIHLNGAGNRQLADLIETALDQEARTRDDG